MLSLFVDALYYDLSYVSYASNISILYMPTPHTTPHHTHNNRQPQFLSNPRYYMYTNLL